MSKSKKKFTLDPYEIYKGIRKVWGFNPKTRVADNDKKKKSRTKKKQDFKKQLREEGY